MTETQTKTQNSNLTFDEPQKIGYCNECKWFRDKQVCGRCRSKNLYAPKDEPHIVGKHADAIIIDESRLTAKCLNCANGSSYKCSKCDGEMYYKYDKDEPQTDAKRGCINCKGRNDCPDAYSEISQYCGAYEQTDCPWK